LEKLRLVQSTQTTIGDAPLEITITTDEEKNTITITDTGIGLTKVDMIDCLGTIARSGSKNFVSEVSGADEASNIIGKFGVGFYSSFMVGERVEVLSRSALEEEESNPANNWSSDGAGDFSIDAVDKADPTPRGTSVVIYLKDSEKEFAKEVKIKKILKKYSNFVNFPVKLNGNLVNTMDAVWSLEPNKVDDETHTAFYKYLANAFDEPMYKLHYR
tara:strand:+ start:151 stop:798 length:648 start_codon:yes stop_codon:yes gene_type:complete